MEKGKMVLLVKIFAQGFQMADQLDNTHLEFRKITQNKSTIQLFLNLLGVIASLWEKASAKCKWVWCKTWIS